MIAHVVLFQPRPDLSPAERSALAQALAAAASDIAGVHGFRVGRRVRHGLPGYEQAMLTDFQFMLLIEVEDVQALTAYLTHPSHQALGQHFTDSAAAALAYDYELVEATAAGELFADEGSPSAGVPKNSSMMSRN